MKFHQFILVLLLGSFISCTTHSGKVKYKEVSIVPKPIQLEQNQTPSFISKTTAIVFDTNNIDLLQSAENFNSFLKKHYQFNLDFNAKSDHKVSLIINKFSNEEEAYQITTSEKNIVITANSGKGIFHGIQTLKQLIYPAQQVINGKLKVPGVKILDSPAYSWRGLHFDVSRHFYDKAEVMKILNAMAEAKMNIFHWHLTDDQGWRIEIKKYPLLTEVGAYRDSMIMGHMADHPSKYRKGRYGGFYTQEDIKEVVAHAAKLGITVVPEIEMPGHAVAALQAYPQFSCKGKDVPAFSEWGVSEHVFCAGNHGTFTFIEDILSEVMELFPGQYIHVGGDECPKTQWESCPKCQSLMKKHALKDEMELQSYFIKRMEKFISSKGKRLVGWNEILEGGLAEGAMVMSWQGLAGGIEAANEGHDVIMSPNAEVYLDHYQSNYYEPLAIAGLTTPREIYEWSPMPAEISNASRKHVLGAQCNVWTEYITTNDHLEYMIFPRLVALAEMLWLGEDKKNFDDFTIRMNEMYARLDALDIKYRIPYPENLLSYTIFTEQKVSLPLTNGIPSSTILYTLNGDDPLVNGKVYTSPLDIDLENDVELKTVTVMPSGRKSQVITASLKYRKAHEPKNIDTKTKGLNCELYKGEFSSVKNIIGEYSKSIVDSITIPNGAPSTFFAVKYKGFVDVPQDGLYRFELTANDGAVLNIDDELVINMDGFSYGKEAYGSMHLKKGLHPINLDFFQAKYGSEIKLEANLLGTDEVVELKYFH